MELHSAAELLFPSVQDTNAKTALFTALFPNMTFLKKSCIIIVHSGFLFY